MERGIITARIRAHSRHRFFTSGRVCPARGTDASLVCHVDVTAPPAPHDGSRPVKVTQIAFPETVSAAVYATGVYASRGSNPTRNANDNVFSDGVSLELATLTGDPTNGYTATFRIGVAV